MSSRLTVLRSARRRWSGVFLRGDDDRVRSFSPAWSARATASKGRRVAEGAGRDANPRKSKDFCGFSILAVSLCVSSSCIPSKPPFRWVRGSLLFPSASATGGCNARVRFPSSTFEHQTKSHGKDEWLAIPAPIRHLSGSRLRSHSRTDRSQETRPPWRNPRPSRDAVERQLSPIAVALAARNDRRHDPPGRNHTGAMQLAVMTNGPRSWARYRV